MDTFIAKSYVINLRSCKDRMETISSQLKKLDIQFERFEAIDGKKLTDEEIDKFVHPTSKYFCSKSMIACALSHYYLWCKIAHSSVEKWTLIMEDDAVLVNDFKNKLSSVKNDIDIIGKENEPDIIKLFLDKDTSGPLSIFIIRRIRQMLNVVKTYSMNTATLKAPEICLVNVGYLISKKGAKKLVNEINKQKIRYHIDSQLEFIDNLKMTVTKENLIEHSIGHSTNQSNFPIFPPMLLFNMSLKKQSWLLGNTVACINNININVSIIVYISLLFIFKNRPNILKIIVGLIILDFIIYYINI